MAALKAVAVKRVRHNKNPTIHKTTQKETKTILPLSNFKTEGDFFIRKVNFLAFVLYINKFFFLLAKNQLFFTQKMPCKR